MNITILRPQTMIAVVCAAVAAQAAPTQAQNLDNLVFRIVAAGEITGNDSFDSIFVVDVREDNTLLVATGSPRRYFIVSESIPWTHLPTLDDALIRRVNASGQVCGIIEIDGTNHPFIASPTGDNSYGPIRLLSIEPYTQIARSEMDIADDGTVVSTVYDDGGRVLLWPPDTTEHVVVTSSMPGAVPIVARAISPTTGVIAGILQINGNLSDSHMFVATTTDNAVAIPGVFLAGHYWAHIQNIADNGTAIVDINGDSGGDFFVRIVRTAGPTPTWFELDQRILSFTSTMSPDGRWATYRNNDPQMMLWFDDGSAQGVQIELRERVWSDREVFFGLFGQLINSQGAMPVGVIRLPGEPRGFALLIPTCRADVNADGSLDPTDFDAWIAAYQSGSHRADQNADGQVTPSDFNAWIAGYNAGCDLP